VHRDVSSNFSTLVSTGHSYECRYHATSIKDRTEVKENDGVSSFSFICLDTELHSSGHNSEQTIGKKKIICQAAQRQTDLHKDLCFPFKDRWQGWAHDVTVPGLGIFLVEPFGR